MIVGEAFSVLRHRFPDVAGQVPYLPQAVAFRNVLVHGYASINDHLVWTTSQEKLAPLILLLGQLLMAPSEKLGNP